MVFGYSLISSLTLEAEYRNGYIEDLSADNCYQKGFEKICYSELKILNRFHTGIPLQIGVQNSYRYNSSLEYIKEILSREFGAG